MLSPDAAAVLEGAMAVTGSLCLALGLGSVLCNRRGGAALSTIHAGSAPSPPERPAPFTSDAAALRTNVEGGPQNPAPPFPHAGRGPLPVPSERGVSPALATPAPTMDGEWQAMILIPAGRYGNYWQSIGRCGHGHRTNAAALLCGGEALARPGAPAGAIVAAGRPE